MTEEKRIELINEFGKELTKALNPNKKREVAFVLVTVPLEADGRTISGNYNSVANVHPEEMSVVLGSFVRDCMKGTMGKFKIE